MRKAARVDANHAEVSKALTQCGGWVGTCGNCGKSIGVDAKGRKRKFCSRECVGHVVGINGEVRIRNPPKEIKCAHCASLFTTYHREKIYCGVTCMKAHWKATGSGGGCGRKDSNHNEITKALEQIGCFVTDMSMLGGGMSDLMVMFRGESFLIEIKNPKTSYGRSGLNKNQKKFAHECESRGVKYHVVRTVKEALSLFGVVCDE